MKLFFLIASLTVACTSSDPAAPDAAPDAPTVYPVHQLLGTGCDEAWDTTGARIQCAAACIQMPDCMADGVKHGKPCDDKPACSNARNRDELRAAIGAAIDCPSTFVAVDSTGGYLGCCVISPASPGTVSVSFYECP